MELTWEKMQRVKVIIAVATEVANAHAARFRKTELLNDVRYAKLVGDAIAIELAISVYIGGIDELLMKEISFYEVIYGVMYDQGWPPAVLIPALDNIK